VVESRRPATAAPAGDPLAGVLDHEARIVGSALAAAGT
jgi:hypothetical protein